jgi:hypothetical protein
MDFLIIGGTSADVHDCKAKLDCRRINVLLHPWPRQRCAGAFLSVVDSGINRMYIENLLKLLPSILKLEISMTKHGSVIDICHLGFQRS